MSRSRLHPRIARTRPGSINRIGYKSFRGLSILILLCTAVFSACSNNQSQNQSGTSGSSQPAVLSIEEVVRIGDEAAGDTVFFAYISDIAVNSRGQIFVEEFQPATIRAFDADGSYLADVGAVGSGPGEYSNPLFGGMFTGQRTLCTFLTVGGVGICLFMGRTNSSLCEVLRFPVSR